jgi:pimeloyl-ACP methyl ester carboxylesterase
MRVLRRTSWLAALLIFLAAGPTTAPDPFAAPFPPTSSFDVGTLHVEEYGAGSQTLVLIPGLSCGPWVWYGTIARFAPKYHIFAITLPGFDGRPATDKRPLFATVKSDFWKMLESRKIEKPIVIGHSLGGTLTIALAEEHPERLSGIVAVDGLPVFPMFAEATADQRKLLAAGMMAGYGKLTIPEQLANARQFMSSIGTNKPELVEPASQLESRGDPRAVGAWMIEDLTQDLRADLKKITVPMLEVMPYNPADNQPPAGYSEDRLASFYGSLLAGVADVKIVPISPSRHFVMLDQPEGFYAVVGEFLGRVAGR